MAITTQLLLLVLVLLSASAAASSSSFRPYKTGKELAVKISGTLDGLLGAGYNKRVRPGFGRRPVAVELNLSVNSIGPVDENTQAYFLDCYFRQSWTDERLAFNTSGISELSLDWKILTMIWKPDTFFLNGKKSKLHKITVPNRFSRITPSGRVSYSQRLTVHASCKMDVKKFPFDSQMCPLLIGSYGYSVEDLSYVWKKKPISIGALGLAQFAMTRWEHGINTTNATNRKSDTGYRTDSIAFLKFYFTRQSGFFILQIYTPLLLIVMCSWVAFWIIKTDVPARCGLGVTTVLSVTKIGFGGTGKPQVPYATALDIFVIICFVSVFASLVEFAFINFISCYVNRRKKRQEDAAAARADKERKEGIIVLDRAAVDRRIFGNGAAASSPVIAPMAPGEDFDSYDVIVVAESSMVMVPAAKKGPLWWARLDAIRSLLCKAREVTGAGLGRAAAVLRLDRIPSLPADTESLLETIDSYSRKCFPSVFTGVMLVYGYLYLMD